MASCGGSPRINLHKATLGRSPRFTHSSQVMVLLGTQAQQTIHHDSSWFMVHLKIGNSRKTDATGHYAFPTKFESLLSGGWEILIVALTGSTFDGSSSHPGMCIIDRFSAMMSWGFKNDCVSYQKGHANTLEEHVFLEVSIFPCRYIWVFRKSWWNLK